MAIGDPRLRYFANVRLPSERANAVQIVNMCSAFAAAGAGVELCHPKRYNPFPGASSSIHEYYGVPDNFITRRLGSLDLIDRLPRACQHPAFRLQSFTFGVASVFRLRNDPGGLVYVRDNATFALLANLMRKPARSMFFYEAHDFPRHSLSARGLIRAVQRCGGVVAITKGLKDVFLKGGIEEERILVAPDGVDLKRFENLPGREEARKALSLPEGTPLAVYAGQFFPWKGVDTLVRAAVRMPRWRVLLVGGREEDRRRLEHLAKSEGAGDRILFQDHVSPDRVPLFLSAADVLMLPNSAKYPISAYFTSPLKLFEYMAAKRPIVASDLPSLREILRHEENALLVPADDPEAFSRAADRLLTDPDLGDRLSSKASKEVVRYGWDERALGILDFMKERTAHRELL